MRGCGLKYRKRLGNGANALSLLVRGCGLKFTGEESVIKRPKVTSRARVWIEILSIVGSLWKLCVTSRARVWIEIWTMTK